MKSSALYALVLALLMLLLVLAAAFLFMYQGRLTLENDLNTAADNYKSLQEQQARTELDQLSAESTRDLLDIMQMTSAAEIATREQDLFDTSFIKDDLQTKEANLSSDLDNANATVQSYESQGPVVNIVEPETDNFAVAGQPVQLVIVASDVEGEMITDVNFNINNDLFSSNEIEPGRSVVLRRDWTPETVGVFTITASATNSQGITKQSENIVITVTEPDTATPAPTEEPTEEPTPEATPEV